MEGVRENVEVDEGGQPRAVFIQPRSGPAKSHGRRVLGVFSQLLGRANGNAGRGEGGSQRARGPSIVIDVCFGEIKKVSQSLPRTRRGRLV